MARRTQVFTAFLLVSALMHGSALHAAKKHFQAQTGYAAYYSKKLQGHRTSSGEKYDMNKLTAAHRTLPFGTMVKVTRLSNGKSVVVRINDRGPFTKGRIIDLSWAAAEEIGMIRSGVAKVRIEPVEPEDIPEEQ